MPSSAFTHKPTRFEETNCTLEVARDGTYADPRPGFYAVCHAGNCGWTGPVRLTAGPAKRDAVRHHTFDGRLPAGARP